MGLKKIIEKGQTRQTNEYWKHVGTTIDEKSGKIFLQFDGFKDQESRTEWAEPDDHKSISVNIDEVFTKAQLDALKTRIYNRATESIPEKEVRFNEEKAEHEVVVVGELNPFVDAEEA